MQRALIVAGVVLFMAGLLWPWLVRLGLGRLPGDIRVDTDHGVFFFPIVTCLIISVIVSLVCLVHPPLAKAYRGSTSSTICAPPHRRIDPSCHIVNASSSRSPPVRATLFGHGNEVSVGTRHQRSNHDCQHCQYVSGRRPASCHLERFARAKHRFRRAIVHFRTDLAGVALAVVLAVGAFLWLDPLHWHLLTPTATTPPTPAVVPPGDAARPTERQEITAPLEPAPATKSVEAPTAPAPAAQAPHAQAPAVQPRTASVKSESRRNQAKANTSANTNGRPSQHQRQDGAVVNQGGGKD